MQMEFQSNYKNRPERAPVILDGEVITEQTGYMSTEALVNQMVLAGQRLYDYRHGLLDIERNMIGDEDDEEVEDQMPSNPYERDLVDQARVIDDEFAYRDAKKKASQKDEKAPTSDVETPPGPNIEKKEEKPVEGPSDA
ncbi:hypothetical protein [Tortoise microvirus 24]|nr:hypothetical protein [Tortoise microvirus 24]